MGRFIIQRGRYEHGNDGGEMWDMILGRCWEYEKYENDYYYYYYYYQVTMKKRSSSDGGLNKPEDRVSLANAQDGGLGLCNDRHMDP